MQVHSFTFNAFQENTYVLIDDEKNAVIVDPGCYERHEEEELQSFIEDNQLKVLAVLGTHAHIDHVLGNQFVMNAYDVPYYLHEKDVATLNAVPQYAHLYGFEGYLTSPQPTHILKGGEVLEFGKMKLEVLFAPGHAPGHVVYYHKESKQLINGDVLFQGSFGRVDLPGGSMEVLKQSIFNVHFKLPDDTIVYAGHGPTTSIGVEKRTNYIHQF